MLIGGFFGCFSFYVRYSNCFICRPSGSTVSEDAGIEPKTVATLTTRLDLIHISSARGHYFFLGALPEDGENFGLVSSQ
jgi:hypothetical protein